MIISKQKNRLFINNLLIIFIYTILISLGDDFSHAKSNVLKMKEFFVIVESHFLKGRGDNGFFDGYRNLI